MRFIIVLLALTASLSCWAQNGSENNSNTGQLLEPVGMLLTVDEYKDIEGTPYVTEDWLEATLKVDSTAIFEKVKIKLNVYANRVHFKDANGQVRVVTGKVNEIKITDKSSSLKDAVFITGLTPQKNIYYRILIAGPKIQLLEKLTARKTDTRVFNGEPKMQIDIDKELYVKTLDGVLLLKGEKKCSTLWSAFGNDKKVAEFADKNGLRCNKKEELVKLIEYYNSY